VGGQTSLGLIGVVTEVAVPVSQGHYSRAGSDCLQPSPTDRVSLGRMALEDRGTTRSRRGPRAARYRSSLLLPRCSLWMGALAVFCPALTRETLIEAIAQALKRSRCRIFRAGSPTVGMSSRFNHHGLRCHSERINY
jgi:hypothetical protein